jgi:hypothetical protein
MNLGQEQRLLSQKVAQNKKLSSFVCLISLSLTDLSTTQQIMLYQFISRDYVFRNF